MVTFVLANPERKTSSVNMLVTLNGKKYKRSVKESVPVKLWNNAKKRAKEITSFPEGYLINDRLNKWDAAGLRAYSHYKEFRNPPTAEQFFKIVEDEYFKDEREVAAPMRFLEYLDLYIERYKPVRAESTVKKYITLKNNLTRYQGERRKKLYFEDIDISFYTDFQRWFYDQDFGDNYFGSQIKIVKQVYAEARDTDRLHQLTGTSHKDFIAVSVDADAIFLTVEELLQIHRLQLTPELIREEHPAMSDFDVQELVASLELARARFLIGAFSGLRVSDFTRLNRGNVTDFIRIMSKKTKFNTVIPIHPVIREILAGGFDLDSTLSDQKINKRIKEIAKFAGLTSVRQFYKRRGGKVVTEYFPQNELVTTHTARRSFATNAYIAGIPLPAIQMVLGHTQVETTMKYLRLTAQQNAEKLADHPFFNDGILAIPNAEPNNSDEIVGAIGTPL